MHPNLLDLLASEVAHRVADLLLGEQIVPDPQRSRAEIAGRFVEKLFDRERINRFSREAHDEQRHRQTDVCARESKKQAGPFHDLSLKRQRQPGFDADQGGRGPWFVVCDASRVVRGELQFALQETAGDCGIVTPISGSATSVRCDERRSLFRFGFSSVGSDNAPGCKI